MLLRDVGIRLVRHFSDGETVRVSKISNSRLYSLGVTPVKV